MHPTGNPKLADWLVSKGMITREQREAALNQQKLSEGRIEEALLETGAIEEVPLLKFLASVHKTRFVSSDKLAKAQIERTTLEKIPRKLAEQSTAFPVMFDPAKSALSVVVADADDTALLQQVKMAAGAKVLHAFVGRPLAVRAAIAKNYGGDIHAFARLDREAHQQFSNMMDVFERNLVSEESMAVALAEEHPRERILTEEQLAGGGLSNGSDLSSDSFLEALNVLVSLIEVGRSDLRGHSAHVARLMAKIAERIGVSNSQKAAFGIAGHLHDLGKMGKLHLTALNAGVSEAHRTRAEQVHTSPTRLMESVKLSQDTVEALLGMYERFGGEGFPAQVSGKKIPLGARLLAIADTYADLTRNSKNPFSRTLSPEQACGVLKKYAPTIFDPNLVELFKHSVTGADLKSRLLANRHLALVVDVDPEETTVLELRMIEQGFEVRVARSPEQALKELAGGDIEIVISELDLGGRDGLALLTEARKRSQGKEVPWVIITKRSDQESADRAFELGVDDYIGKPVNAGLLVAKLKQLIERRGRPGKARGVSGSLEEMGLPDIVQVLWHGRKTGRMNIRAPQGQGEIHFVEGQVFNALYGKLRGADAFYAMVGLEKGEFAVDPSFKAPQRVIEDSPEGLLLEGMRRLDEGTL